MNLIQFITNHFIFVHTTINGLFSLFHCKEIIVSTQTCAWLNMLIILLYKFTEFINSYSVQGRVSRLFISYILSFERDTTLVICVHLFYFVFSVGDKAQGQAFARQIFLHHAKSPSHFSYLIISLSCSFPNYSSQKYQKHMHQNQ